MPPKRVATKRKIDDSKNRKSDPPKNDLNIQKIVDIFKESQIHSGSHDRLSVQLKSIYKSMSFDEFWENFLELTRYPMIVMEQSANVDRVISFIVNFSLFLCRGDEDGASVENANQDSAVLLQLLEFCCEWNDAAKPAVRYRCVQIMRRILAGLGHEATISDTLFFTIQTKLLSRAWDVKATIRAEAANALSRMQDPVNRDCPIITTLLHLLKHDPNVEVRKAALLSIAITTKTLPAIIERTQDIADIIRKKAYSILKSKSLLKPLSIAKRLRLLQDGLNDASQTVKDECKAMLIRWFELCEKDPLNLLKRLDVEGSRDVTEQALKVLLNSQSSEDILQSMTLMLTEELVLKEEYYSQEAAFYWRVVCLYFRSNSDDGYQMVEKILPLGKEYAEFLKKLITRQWSLIDAGDSDAFMDQECMCTHVIELASFIDLSDEFGRQSLISMTRQFLTAPNCPVTSIEPLLKLYSVLEPDQYRLCDIVVELISEIRDPHRLAVEDRGKLSDQSNSNDITAPNSKKILSEIGDISSKISDLNDLIEHAPEDYNLNDLKEKKVELEKKMEELSSSINMTNPEVTADHTADTGESAHDVSAVSLDATDELNDYNILLKCNVMIVKVLQSSKKIWRLTSCLRSLLESLVLSSVQSVHPGVRNQAVKALGLLSILNQDVALKYMYLFLQIVKFDIETVQLSALAAIIDCFLVFGLEPFKDIQLHKTEERNEADNGEEDGEDMFGTKSSQEHVIGRTGVSSDESDEDDTLVDEENDHSADKTVDPTLWATKLLSVLISRLDSPSSSIRTVCGKGLAKLMLHGRVASPKLLSRLILLWFNPLTEDDVSLLHLLSHFLNNYSSSSLKHQRYIGDAILPTLKTLFRAPASSPLCEVEPWNVAYLLLSLTDSMHLKEEDNKTAGSEEKLNKELNIDESPFRRRFSHKDNPVHDDIALTLANEIMNAPSASGVKIYVRMLCNIRLSKNNTQVVKDLLVILHPIIKKMSDRVIKNMLVRLQKDLQSILTKLGISLTPHRIPMTPRPSKVRPQKVSSLSKSFLSELEDPTLIMEENSDVNEENSDDETAVRNKKVSFLNATYLSQRFKQSMNINNNQSVPPENVEEENSIEGSTRESDDSNPESEEEEVTVEEDTNSQPDGERSKSSHVSFTKPALKLNKTPIVQSEPVQSTSGTRRSRQSSVPATPSTVPNVRRVTRRSMERTCPRQSSLRESTSNK